MGDFITRLSLCAILGMIIVYYFWLMNWSLKWYIEFRRTTHNRKRDKKRRSEYSKDDVTWNKMEQYCWKEIVAVPVYIITWIPPLFIGLALIGGLFYGVYLLIISLASMGGI